ncbi:hypothetical protein GIB67_006174 [Kingdonia uniflora]|uniref:Nicastrin n=1 Tax=Kingdonia uniflora TaxID=39325 RepID=A0A7J7LQ66_9MAGN|nr:hypothetical protein GIB67_006174 [Kingdonia uniflora]
MLRGRKCIKEQNVALRILNDESFAKKVGGVVVESGTNISSQAKGFSPVEKFPEAKFAPYQNLNYEWNPAGSSIMLNNYNFPVFLLSQDSTLVLQEIADKNDKNKKAYTVDVAEFNLIMQTTKAGTHDSESCLKEQSCLPLGGYRQLFGAVEMKDSRDIVPTALPKTLLTLISSFIRRALPNYSNRLEQASNRAQLRLRTIDSLNFRERRLPTLLFVADVDHQGNQGRRFVFDEESDDDYQEGSVMSSLPPINITSSKRSKPIILAVASMDSASFFRDKSLGADSPLSGMISLLAAIDALSHIDALSELNKQLIFLICTGEAWGYLGSRRFLAELDMHTDAVDGLNGTLVEMILEVGSTGKSFTQGVNSFFTHSAGDASTTNKTLIAFKNACESLGSETIKISTAKISNPGIPPSSMMAFLSKNSSTSGIVLEDFDTAFLNKFYHSHLDDLSNVNSSSIVAAASLVARTLYILASGKKESSTSELNSINVNSSLVEELLGCLLTCEPGLSCGLVKDYITPTNTCPNHYVGVLMGAPSSKPYLAYVSDVSRFLWNFLADRTSSKEDRSSVCSEDCSSKGQVCIRTEPAGKGTCVVSTTRYIPAYSTRLKFDSDSGTWSVLPPNSSDPMGMVDPVWTESFWDEIQLRVYTVQSATYDRFILAGGIAVTVLAYLTIVATRAMVTKALKRD